MYREIARKVWAAARDKNDPQRRTDAIELILLMSLSILVAVVPAILRAFDL
ncbi:hypothetical protein [Amycolatopsis magusensis]|uniref:hypothetical protein n=1 Tax=Amycolatopsis magusensis TaxID=882444 RepID=UPI0037A5AF34